MRVGIDCYKLQKGKGKSIGIYNYAKILIRLVAERTDRNYDLVVFGNSHNKQDMAIEGVEFIEYTASNGKIKDILWELHLVKSEARKHRIDLMVYPRGFIPLYIGSRANDLVVVHDMIPFYYQSRYPRYVNKLEGCYIRSRLRYSIKNALKVVTISEFSRRQISALAERNDINMIYNAFEPAVIKASQDLTHEIKALQLQNREPYILAITSSLPHKNARGVFDAYERYIDRGGHNNLVVVGLSGKEALYPLSEVASQKTVFLPYLSDAALQQFMKRASSFLFMSEIEGFGYPPIEAMSVGTPVVSSGGGALAEVVGEGGLIIDNPEQAAEALLSLDLNDRARRSLIELGRKNIERFGSERFSLEIDALISDCLKGLRD